MEGCGNIQADWVDLVSGEADRSAGCVIVIGNFDGVHLGHQCIISHAKERAVLLGIPLVLLTFSPHPYVYFKKCEEEGYRLANAEQNKAMMKKSGVNSICTLRFDQYLADMSAQSFMDDVLSKHLHAKEVVVGDNFCFGHGRVGDVALLKSSSSFKVHACSTYMSDGEIVSSSRIRQSIMQGDMKRASLLLGRLFTVRGEVLHGAKLGRTIDFPTINLQLGHYVRPAYGVYYGYVRLKDQRYHESVMSFGVRPTIENQKEELLECYIFDFNQEIYGDIVDVMMVGYIRGEEKFPSLEALKLKIQEDAAIAKKNLAVFDRDFLDHSPVVL